MHVGNLRALVRASSLLYRRQALSLTQNPLCSMWTLVAPVILPERFGGGMDENEEL